jgi:hypothetical protein
MTFDPKPFLRQLAELEVELALKFPNGIPIGFAGKLDLLQLPIVLDESSTTVDDDTCNVVMNVRMGPRFEEILREMQTPAGMVVN